MSEDKLTLHNSLVQEVAQLEVTVDGGEVRSETLKQLT